MGPDAVLALATAMRGYKELNLRALKMLRPGGVLAAIAPISRRVVEPHRRFPGLPGFWRRGISRWPTDLIDELSQEETVVGPAGTLRHRIEHEVPRGGGFLDHTIDPPALPAWISEADIDFYTKEFARRTTWRFSDATTTN